ncbi:MAG: acyltransferase [Candidatus Omnitrophota bacterium]|nr:acyltransferase [Candidatus Omnitrophota bacterium]
MSSAYAASPLQKIAPDVRFGRDVIVRDFVNLYGCEIGDESQIGPFVEVQKNARIGKRCKISSHSFICEGVTIEDGVFLGHGVMFTNGKYPSATNPDGSLQTEKDWICEKTLVKKGASIGSGSSILCGITIGENALIGAGSVVTRDIPDGARACGNPARLMQGASDIEGR